MKRLISFRNGRQVCPLGQGTYQMGRRRSEEIQALRRGIEYDLIPWSEEHKIPAMAYTPLGEGRLRGHRTLTEIARRHNATPTQIMLAWVMRTQNVIAIPKASSAAHVEENAGSLDVSLTEEDLQEIDKAFPAPKHKIPLAGW